MAEHTSDRAATGAAPKTWGPFTGRQLATIICVLVVALTFPFGAWAVSGSNAFITDAVSGNHASVSNGALVTNVAPTHNFISSPIAEADDQSLVPLLTTPTTHANVITQVDVDWHGMTTPTDYMMITLAKVDPLNPGNGPCGLPSSKAFEQLYFPNASDYRQLMFNPGFVVPGGLTLCFGFVGSGSITSRAYGYFTASTAVVSPFLGRMMKR
jgi:hypothetical protein